MPTTVRTARPADHEAVAALTTRMDAARADGCTLVRLSSQESMTAADRLYERAGFARAPSFDWSPVPGLRLRTYALGLAP